MVSSNSLKCTHSHLVYIFTYSHSLKAFHCSYKKPTLARMRFTCNIYRLKKIKIITYKIMFLITKYLQHIDLRSFEVNEMIAKSRFCPGDIPHCPFKENLKNAFNIHSDMRSRYKLQMYTGMHACTHTNNTLTHAHTGSDPVHLMISPGVSVVNASPFAGCCMFCSLIMACVSQIRVLARVPASALASNKPLSCLKQDLNSNNIPFCNFFFFS